MSYTPTTWVEKVTKVGPTNLNKLELGLQSAAAVADAAMPAPAGLSNGALVWNGSSWVAALIANANISASAAIALSKLADPGSGNVITSVGAGAVAAKPPGYEFDYASITSAVSITATTEDTATTIVTGNAVTYDGSTSIIVEFFSPYNLPGSTNVNLIICLYDGAASIGQWSNSVVNATGSQFSLLLRKRLTPSAGSHTYSARAFVGSGTGTVGAGTGAHGTNMQAFIRITKV